MNTLSIIEYSSDLETAEAPPPLPIGIYPAYIEEADVKDSKTTGKPYLAMWLRIPPEAYPADFAEGDPDGTRVSYNRVQVEDTAMGRYRMRMLRQACGLRPGGRTVDPSEFVGLSVTIAVGHDDGSYDGVPKPTCDKIIAS